MFITSRESPTINFSPLKCIYSKEEYIHLYVTVTMSEVVPIAPTSDIHCRCTVYMYRYRRLGFECVVKRLQMVLYKPDCDSNNCELPNEKATPSILAIEVWLVTLHVGWAINRIPYIPSSNLPGRLTVGLKNRRLVLDNRQLYVHACKSVEHT